MLYIIDINYTYIAIYIYIYISYHTYSLQERLEPLEAGASGEGM